MDDNRALFRTAVEDVDVRCILQAGNRSPSLRFIASTDDFGGLGNDNGCSDLSVSSRFGILRVAMRIGWEC